MSVRAMLGAACAFLAALAVSVSAQDAAPPARPNIVVILADDLGWKDVSYAGGAYPTPNVDRLAREGLVFTQAYAAAPSCSPTRAALLTGRSPARLGLTRAIRIKDYQQEDHALATPPGWPWPCLPYPNATRLPADVPTFADELRGAGYETAYVGKWHLGRPEDGPAQHGFEHEAFVGSVGGSGYFPPYNTTKNGPVKRGDYLTDRLTDTAVAFLRREHERPFCLFLAHFAVHAPIRGKPELVERFSKELAQGTPQSNAEYAAMIWSLDEGVGRVLATLEERGLAANTLVVFTSDNGPVLEHDGVPLTTTAPLRAGKLDLHEGGLRVPLVVRWPGRTKAGATSAVPVISTDLFPTLLGAAGLAPKADGTLDGVDLGPLLAGGSPPQRERLCFFVPHRDASAALRAGDWKLVHSFRGKNELYDLARDPSEALDLADKEPERAHALEQDLVAWIRASGAALPEPSPQFDPSKPLPGGTDDE